MTNIIPAAPVVYPTVDEWADNPCAYLQSLHQKFGETSGIVKIVIPHPFKPNYKIWKDPKTKFTAKQQPLGLIDGLSRQDALFELQLRIDRFSAGQSLPRAPPQYKAHSIRLYQLNSVLGQGVSLEAISSNPELIRLISPGLHQELQQERSTPNTASETTSDLYHALQQVVSVYLNKAKSENNAKVQPEIPKNTITVVKGAQFFKAYPDNIMSQVVYKDQFSGRSRLVHEDGSELLVTTADLQLLYANGKTEESARTLEDMSQTDSIDLCEVCSVVCRDVTCSGCGIFVHRSCYPSVGDACYTHDWFCPKCQQPHAIPVKALSDFGYIDLDAPVTIKDFKKKSLLQYEAEPVEKVEETFLSCIRGTDRSLAEASAIYGSDLDSLDITEYPHKDEFEKSRTSKRKRWDLRLLPIHPKSLLSALYQMGDVITGVSRPWVYAGSPLSAFCWHAEDHYLYSLNFLHEGKPKIWYGCPGQYLNQIQALMREKLPLLYDANPDLHHHLVTFMDPQLFIEAGLPVQRIEQHQGELVVTFPQAYHAGFNSGFNIAEAVNVACEDWLAFGIHSETRYSIEKRDQVFSIDRLVWELTNSSNAASPLLLETALSRLELMKTYDAHLPPYKVPYMNDSRKRSDKNIIKCTVCKRICSVVAVRLPGKADEFVCHEHYIAGHPGCTFECIPYAEISERIESVKQKLQPYLEWANEASLYVKHLGNPGESSLTLPRISRARTRAVKRAKVLSSCEAITDTLNELKQRGNLMGVTTINHPILKEIEGWLSKIQNGKITLGPLLEKVELTVVDLTEETERKRIKINAESMKALWDMRFLICPDEDLRRFASVVYRDTFIRRKTPCDFDQQLLEETATFLSKGELRLLRKHI